MSNVLYRWGRAAARHPWRMLGAWLIVVLGVVALRSAVGGNPSDNFTIPGTEAQRGIDLLDERPAQGGSAGRSCLADPAGRITDPAARAAVEPPWRSCAGPNVLGVTDPYDPATSVVSRDGRIAYTTVRYRAADPPGKVEGSVAEAAVETAPGRVAGRDLPDDHPTAEPVEGREGIGLIVAVVVFSSPSARSSPRASRSPPPSSASSSAWASSASSPGSPTCRRSHPSSPR
jgi:RND superfamily putative drug exporter